MDLRLFHHPDYPDWDYRDIDRKNSRTGGICYFLEWAGWYNTTIQIRLLGHYRLFQLSKSRNAIKYTGLSPEQAYILHYREKRLLKYSWIRLLPFLSAFIIKEGNPEGEVQSTNRILLNKRTDILQTFLFDAEVDFEQALLTAVEQILDLGFLSDSPLTKIQLQVHQNHQHNTSLSKNEFHVHPVVKEQVAPPPPTKGKEKDVFSKKQLLILFDLLAKTGKIEPLDLRKPNKFPAIAHLLRAITGKGEDSWREELNNYRQKNLYTWHTDGERREIIRMLQNLAEKLRKAGLESIAKLAEQKVIELEHAAP